MKRKITKKIGLITMFAVMILTFPINITMGGEDDLDVNGFEIIPELTTGEKEEIQQEIINIGSEGGKVWDKYNEAASGFTTSQQISSGIMNRDTILNYISFVVRFLSQLGLLIGTIFIMYAGYKYVISVFQGGKVPSAAVKNAIIGVIIVIFSYAIMRILTSFVGLN